MNIASAADEVMALLKSAGVKNVSVDARKLALPGVLVSPSTISVDRFDTNTGTITWEAYAIAGDQGPMEALVKLGRLMGMLHDMALNGEFEHTTVTLINHNSGGLPALKFSIVTEVQG